MKTQRGELEVWPMNCQSNSKRKSNAGGQTMQHSHSNKSSTVLAQKDPHTNGLVWKTEK
jgi:hypothetical protein